MAISDRLNKLTTDITNAYTSIENKGGTIPANKNTNNLPTAINSIEVIEQATAEGESLSLTNTKAMPYSDYVVKGKSEQTTRSGKNLLQNTATSQTISGVTFTVNEDGSVTCNGTATNNIFFPLTGNNSIENIIVSGCPAGGNGDSYLVRAIDTNGRVLKTDFGEGTEVFNLINARIQIRIAKDYICNNLTFYPMIRLATIEDDTYEPYGASPSPEYPSEIHSVADDVNLLDLENIENHSVNYYYENIGTNFQLKAGETYTLSFDAESDITPFNVGIGCGSSGNYQSDISDKNGFQNGRISITFTPQNSHFTYGNYLAVRFVKYNNSTSYKYSAKNIKLQKGTEATPYSPYNQGTVTIKQRGKNLWTSNLPIIFSDRSSIVQDNNNGGIDMTLAKTTSSGYIFYDLGLISDFAGKTLTFSISNEPNALYKWCAFVACNADGSNRQELKNFYENNQITYTIGNSYSQTHLAIRLYISEGTPNTTYSINNVQVEEGTQATPYEPYQANDYTFQTEPLRSLPNGVKDTIEEDGIHRRVGRVVLDGSEDENWALSGTNTTGYYRFSSAIINNIVEKPSSNSQVVDILSNNYMKKSADNTYSLQTGICIATNGAIIIYDENLKQYTVENFKTWLSTHNTEVLYELAQETIEPLTQNQATTMLDIIKTGSYEGTTNIYTDEDVKPTMKVDYYKKA